LLGELNIYRNKQKPGYIDIWWLFDDGGLTLLLPFILKNKKLWERNELRVFSVGTKISRMSKDQQQLTTLLKKFRIPAEHVTVLPDIAQKPSKESVDGFNELISPWKLADGESQEEMPWKISAQDMKTHKDKINTHLRTRELLLEHSCRKAIVTDNGKTSKGPSETNLIVLTLPIPRKNGVPAALYMSWLEFISRDVGEREKDSLQMPPVLFVRGNQTSVLTYYS
jgi:solute carrier family 12 sodium/potassium/chloride transporter 2